NQKGEMVIPAQFDRASDFDRNVARVVVNGLHGLIDSKGKYIQRPKFTDIGEFDENGLAVVRYGNENIRYGVINLQGQLITNKDYREISSYREGLAVVKYREGYGYI